MKEWRLFWNLHDSGKEIVEAETKEDAVRIFREMRLSDLLGHDSNIADVGMIYEVREG